MCRAGTRLAPAPNRQETAHVTVEGVPAWDPGDPAQRLALTAAQPSDPEPQVDDGKGL